MDRPDLDATQHHRALAGLARLNRLSGSVGILWPSIAALSHQLGRPVSILDLATGGGDIPVGLWQRARQQGLPADLCGVDISPRAVEIAQARAELEKANARFLLGIRRILTQEQWKKLRAEMPRPGGGPPNAPPPARPGR